MYHTPKPRRILLKRLAVAASLSIVMIAGWKLFQQKEKAAIAQQATTQSNTPATTARREANTTRKDKKVVLPDGSLVVLARNSEIAYYYPFRQRSVSLLGKAFFKVTKDATKPFTVYSRNISTTVLGTEFTITAYDKAVQQTVRLYQGKVLVQPVERNNRRMKSGFYLLPGQEFIYKEDAVAMVRNWGGKDKTRAEENVAAADVPEATNAPAIPLDTAHTWY